MRLNKVREFGGLLRRSEANKFLSKQRRAFNIETICSGSIGYSAQFENLS